MQFLLELRCGCFYLKLFLPRLAACTLTTARDAQSRSLLLAASAKLFAHWSKEMTVGLVNGLLAHGLQIGQLRNNPNRPCALQAALEVRRTCCSPGRRSLHTL